MEKFENYIENFDIYTDEEEKSRIIERCITDFNQLKYFKNLEIEENSSCIPMQLRKDEIKQSFLQSEVFKNTNKSDKNFFVVG